MLQIRSVVFLSGKDMMLVFSLVLQYVKEKILYIPLFLNDIITVIIIVIIEQWQARFLKYKFQKGKDFCCL